MAREIIGLFDNWKNLLEVGVLFLVFFVLLCTLRGTRGERILKSLAALCVVAVIVLWLTDSFGLHRLRFLANSILGASVIVVIILFHPELRRGLSQILRLPFGESTPESNVLEELVSAVAKLSKNKVGAIIALERNTGLRTYIDGGIRIDALVRGELLETIFYPGSPLHDGAVVISNARIAAAECLFPLTDNPHVSKRLGTRHRAGIGLSEETDAVVVIVSEETGTVSLGVGGELRRGLDRDALLALLTELTAKEEPGLKEIEAAEAASGRKEGA